MAGKKVFLSQNDHKINIEARKYNGSQQMLIYVHWKMREGRCSSLPSAVSSHTDNVPSARIHATASPYSGGTHSTFTIPPSYA